jgi:hypothetical protein
MRVAGTLVIALCAAGTPSADARPPDPHAFGSALVTKLRTKPGLHPETHATDFGDDALGCITFPQWELKQFGYRGHAFACEEGATHEVLGAVLNRAGAVRCYITGDYIGDGCFALEICGDPQDVCLE